MAKISKKMLKKINTFSKVTHQAAEQKFKCRPNSDDHTHIPQAPAHSEFQIKPYRGSISPGSLISPGSPASALCGCFGGTQWHGLCWNLGQKVPRVFLCSSSSEESRTLPGSLWVGCSLLLLRQPCFMFLLTLWVRSWVTRGTIAVRRSLVYG